MATWYKCRRKEMADALQGITVLELTRVSPAAFCTMMLADMGAEVLKIETPPILSPGAASGMSAGQAKQAAYSPGHIRHLGPSPVSIPRQCYPDSAIIRKRSTAYAAAG
jgi:hypothetical protein